MTLVGSAGTYVGLDPQPSFRPVRVEVAGDAGLYTFPLSSTTWTPVVVEPGVEPAWEIELTAPEAGLTDVVIAFWWRVG